MGYLPAFLFGKRAEASPMIQKYRLRIKDDKQFEVRFTLDS
jgi:hypothetical protein